MALIGSNVDENIYEGMRKASEFKGAPTMGIGKAGDTKVLRFDPHVVKKHIKRWVETRPKFKFMGVEDLILAEKHGQLRQGRVFYVIDVPSVDAFKYRLGEFCDSALYFVVRNNLN